MASDPGQGIGAAVCGRNPQKPGDYPSWELICAGAEEGVLEPLADYLRQSTADNLSVLIKTPATAGELEKTAPFTASYPLPEKDDLYYLCQNGTCSAPVQSFNELKLQ